MKQLKKEDSELLFVEKNYYINRTEDRESGEQTTWIKQSLPQRYVCVGCQLNSDQALRLLCLKGHVRARESTL